MRKSFGYRGVGLEPSNQFMRLDQKFLSKAKTPRRDFGQLEARRREGMRLLEEGHAQADVARLLGVSEVSVSRWKRAFQCRGNDAWRRGRLGKPPKVEEHHLTVIRQFLSAGARIYGYLDDRWTYPRIASVLEVLTGLRIHPDHLCRVFHRAGLTTTRKASPAAVPAGNAPEESVASPVKRAVREMVVR